MGSYRTKISIICKELGRVDSRLFTLNETTEDLILIEAIAELIANHHSGSI